MTKDETKCLSSYLSESLRTYTISGWTFQHWGWCEFYSKGESTWHICVCKGKLNLNLSTFGAFSDVVAGKSLVTWCVILVSSHLDADEMWICTHSLLHCSLQQVCCFHLPHPRTPPCKCKLAPNICLHTTGCFQDDMDPSYTRLNLHERKVYGC